MNFQMLVPTSVAGLCSPIRPQLYQLAAGVPQFVPPAHAPTTCFIQHESGGPTDVRRSSRPPEPQRTISILAKSVFRELKEGGSSRNDMLALATDLLVLVGPGIRNGDADQLRNRAWRNDRAKSILQEMKAQDFTKMDVVSFVSALLGYVSADIRATIPSEPPK